jgi:hypothetical protein
MTYFMLCAASVWVNAKPREALSANHILVLICTVFCMPTVLYVTRHHTVHLLDRKYWTPLKGRDASERIDKLLDSAGIEGKIATLSPALLIESKHQFYLELATGPFFFQIAQYLPAEKIARLRGVSPLTLSTLLAADRPAAIFGGHEARLDEPFFQFARAHGYCLIEDQTIDGILYIREPSALCLGSTQSKSALSRPSGP